MALMNNNIVVCAYHNVGYRCIEELLRQGAGISLIFTHEDSPTEEIWFQSVSGLADRHGIPCLTTDINDPGECRAGAGESRRISSFPFITGI